MSIVTNLLLWGLRRIVIVPDSVHDWILVKYATMRIEGGFYYDVLDASDQINSLAKRDSLLSKFAAGFLYDGDVRTAREIVRRISSSYMKAFVWAIIAGQTKESVDCTSFESALSEIPESERANLRREVLKAPYNSRR